ncbi:hypothetical protein CVT25_001708 [Psilocybe cyanescens]|uniref:Uncharacterized protein n=1 Tax=Psilocybe cyanescens TaxID=93625 RepID=A0A409WPH8_PSICY|nr:hypothetical protein CVT25_001708 [Psilocybe cyanescens]
MCPMLVLDSYHADTVECAAAHVRAGVCGSRLGKKGKDFTVALPRFRIARKLEETAANYKDSTRTHTAQFQLDEWVESVMIYRSFLRFRMNTTNMIREVLALIDALTRSPPSVQLEYGTNDSGKGKGSSSSTRSRTSPSRSSLGICGTRPSARSLRTWVGGHLDDLFGRLGHTSFEKYGSQADLEKDAIKHLFVASNKDAASDPAVNASAVKWFKCMEDRDEDALRNWRVWKEMSVRKYQKEDEHKARDGGVPGEIIKEAENVMVKGEEDEEKARAECEGGVGGCDAVVEFQAAGENVELLVFVRRCARAGLEIRDTGSGMDIRVDKIAAIYALHLSFSPSRSFVIAAAMFTNSNALPIALMHSLVVSVPDLARGSDDKENVRYSDGSTFIVGLDTDREGERMPLLADFDDDEQDLRRHASSSTLVYSHLNSTKVVGQFTGSPMSSSALSSAHIPASSGVPMLSELCHRLECLSMDMAKAHKRNTHQATRLEQEPETAGDPRFCLAGATRRFIIRSLIVPMRAARICQLEMSVLPLLLGLVRRAVLEVCEGWGDEW